MLIVAEITKNGSFIYTDTRKMCDCVDSEL